MPAPDTAAWHRDITKDRVQAERRKRVGRRPWRSLFDQTCEFAVNKGIAHSILIALWQVDCLSPHTAIPRACRPRLITGETSISLGISTPTGT
jgi:hypothetical protein